MPRSFRSICPLGQFYSEAVSDCRDCGTICGFQYGGETAECLDNCPGYGLTTLSYGPTTMTAPSVTDSSGPGYPAQPWLIGVVCAAIVVCAAFVGFIIILVLLLLRKKCCFKVTKVYQPTCPEEGKMIVAEETGQDGKSKLVVNTA